MKYKIGDIVIAIEGGPKMTINSSYVSSRLQLFNQKYKCWWFEGNILNDKEFDEGQIMLYTDWKAYQRNEKIKDLLNEN